MKTCMLTVRMDTRLYELFKEFAARQGLSMNKAAIDLFQEAIEHEMRTDETGRLLTAALKEQQ